MKKGIFIAAAVIFSGYAQAQKDTATKTLDEVIITANKFPQKQSTTGKVITVIRKEQIEKSSGSTVGQLLNQQAGISISGALNNLGSNQTVYLRGASAGRTLILMDGIPVYDPSVNNNYFDLNLVSLNNVESIEICRGAQSTLYGSDAIAGVINILTLKKDITSPFNLKATVSGGNHGTYRGNLQLFGKANKFIYNIRYDKLVSNGFSSAYDSTGIKNFDNDSYNGDVASASLQYQVIKDLSFKAFMQYSRYKTDLDAAAFTDEKDYSVKNKGLITGFNTHYQKNNISLTGNYQYTQSKRNYFNDSLDVPGFVTFSTDNYIGQTQFAEVFSNIFISKNFNFLQGADYRYSNFHSNYFSLSSYGPYTSTFKDTSQSQASLYGSIIYHTVNEKLNVELGGRLNVHSRYGSNHTYTFNPSYNITNHFRIFGSVATGFKAPTLYQLYSEYGNLDLKPERSTTYEAGVQQKHEHFTTRLVYFDRKIKNGIDFDNNLFQYFNFTNQHVNGIEFESKLIPVKKLTISANYTYLNPRETSQSRITFKDSIYKYLIKRPANNFNLIAGYQFEKGLYISISGKYAGSHYDVGDYQAADILLNGYFLLSAYAEYKFKKFTTLFVNAQNILNKKFFDIRGYNSIPFLINGGITFTW
jgi:vitamin B12 transporter